MCLDDVSDVDGLNCGVDTPTANVDMVSQLPNNDSTLLLEHSNQPS